MKPFTDSSGAIHNPDELQANAARDGYLFFRGLIDPEPLLNLRREILQLCKEAGWIAPATDPMEGIAAPDVKLVEPEPEFMDVYDRIMKLESFHALAHFPAMVEMYDLLFGEPTLVHPRNIARVIFPGNAEYTTPAHQDYIHIRGTAETYTSWIPLGECPEDLGSLAVLAGSHRSGIYPTHAAKGAGGQGIDTDGLAFEWHGNDFRLGDVLVFHSHVIHRALVNRSADRLRLSVDYRYQPASHPVTEGSLLPHYARVPWVEIYEEWDADDHQYYWERLPLQRVG